MAFPLPAWAGHSSLSVLLMTVAMMMTVMETRDHSLQQLPGAHQTAGPSSLSGPTLPVSSSRLGLCLFEQSSVCCLIFLNCAGQLFIFWLLYPPKLCSHSSLDLWKTQTEPVLFLHKEIAFFGIKMKVLACRNVVSRIIRVDHTIGDY